MRLKYFTFALFMLILLPISKSFAFEVSPSAINLSLAEGETAIENASITISPFCVRPFLIDVESSDPDAIVTNLTGTILNGCGGDISSFDIEFTGAGINQSFDLNFVDAEFGGILGTIPVTIDTPLVEEELLGLLIKPKGIVFQVASSGCTTKEDFKVEILESFPLQLRLVRINEDYCDAFVPYGTKIRFSYKALGLRPGDQFKVINPLAVNTIHRL